MFEKLLKKAEKDKDLLAVIVYGSVARNEKNEDVDVCLVLSSEKENKRKQLEYLKDFGDDFDIHVFQELPLYIRSRVVKEGKVLLSKDKDKLHDLYVDTIKEYFFFEPHYKTYLEAVAHG